MSLRENRSWQFLVGCFCLFVAYKIWSMDILQAYLSQDEEGFESVSLIPLLLTACVSAIQMVGLVAICVVGFAKPFAEKVVDYLRAKMPRVDSAAKTIEEKVDAEKLVETLNNLDERIRSIEIKVRSEK